jgi:hypothetical protein
MILRKLRGYPSHHEYLRAVTGKRENEELEGSPQIMLIAI